MAAGGDATLVTRLPGGGRSVVVGAFGTLVLGSALLPPSISLDDDERRREARTAPGATAILRTRPLAGPVGGDLRDLTGHAGRALDEEHTWDVASDGRTAVAVWAVAEPGGSRRYPLVAIDLETGERRTLADDPDHEHGGPKVSPDGTRVAVVVRRRADPNQPGDRWVGLVPIGGGAIHPLTAGWDRWPHSPTWTPDGRTLVVGADDHGRAPLCTVNVDSGEVTRLTAAQVPLLPRRGSPERGTLGSSGLRRGPVPVALTPPMSPPLEVAVSEPRKAPAPREAPAPRKAPSPRKATSAGMYDYALGGTANTRADRRAVDAARRILPELSDGIWANRGFVQRAVTRMAADWGIRQFLDLGAGLPTQRSTHDVVAEVIPDGRVVYVDNDPGVVERGRQIIAGLERAAVVEADIRDADAVLAHPDTQRLLDLTQPVGIVAAAVLHFIPDADDPWGAMARYVAAVPSGSCLALCALTSDRQAPGLINRVRRTMMSVRFHLRSKAQMERFFDGLDVVPPFPGALPIVTHAGVWGAEDPELANDDGSRWFYAAVGRKP